MKADDLKDPGKALQAIANAPRMVPPANHPPRGGLTEVERSERRQEQRQRAEELIVGYDFKKQSEGSWRGNCPLDRQHRGALLVSADEDGLVILCEHGCELAKIHAALQINAPSLTRLSDVMPQEVSWLWQGRVPFGKLTVIDGAPGLGKSTVGLDIAARLTSGRAMPGETETRPPACALVVACEDGLADTVRPRFDAAGGDPHKLVMLNSYRDAKGKEKDFSLPAGIPALARAIRELQVKLVVIDPLSAYLEGDTHNDAEARRGLGPLARLADATGAAVIVIRHVKKAPALAINAGGGATGIIAAARSGLLVAKDPQDEDLRLFASFKLNLGKRPRAWRFGLAAENDKGAARIDWRELCDANADDLTSQLPPQEDQGKVTEAVAFLKNALAEGPVLVTDLFDQARENGITRSTLKRAFLRPETETFRFGGLAAKWYRRQSGDQRLPTGQGPLSGRDVASEPEAAWVP